MTFSTPILHVRTFLAEDMPGLLGVGTSCPREGDSSQPHGFQDHSPAQQQVMLKVMPHGQVAAGP